MVDQVPNLLNLGTIDLLLMPNEPDGRLDPVEYANWVKAIKQWAVQKVPNVLIGGPQLSSWALDHATSIPMWLRDFTAAGGMDALDVLCIHPYVGAQDPTKLIPEFIADLTSLVRGKPLVFTEMGIASAYADTRLGGHTPALMAQGMADYVTGCSGFPCIVYDGPYAFQGNQYPAPMTTVNNPPTGLTQDIVDPSNLATGQPVGFVHAGTTIGVGVVQSITLPHSVVLDVAIGTVTGDVLVNSDYNASMSYWASGWAGGGVGQTVMGSDLAAGMPPR